MNSPASLSFSNPHQSCCCPQSYNFYYDTYALCILHANFDKSRIDRRCDVFYDTLLFDKNLDEGHGYPQ